MVAERAPDGDKNKRLSRKGRFQIPDFRYQILDNNSFTVNDLQSKTWHLISDIFLKNQSTNNKGINNGCKKNF
jgi:hypothetical protein